MILDTLDNLKMYTGLNPLFPKVVEFIQSHDLSSMPLGKTAIIGDELYVTIADAQPKSQEEAVVETHRQMIDIQIPLSGTETHGFAPLSSLEEATYQEQDDISFYTRPPQTFCLFVRASLSFFSRRTAMPLPSPPLCCARPYLK